MTMEPYVLLVYHFSPIEDSVEKLKFDSKEEMNEYIADNVNSGESCLYYPESSLPFVDGWDELTKSSHMVFD